jgi:ketosteroid isomerase-like protein
MTDADSFFDDYAAALLARDEKRMAKLYAVPSLILFPGQSIPVTSEEQTEQFFAASWAQYDGVDMAERKIAVMASTPASIWADVTWSYGGRPRERFCYQLVRDADTWKIAVLTPLALS